MAKLSHAVAAVSLAASTSFGAAWAQADALQALLDGPLPPLQKLYLRCVTESEQRALSSGEAASCSQAYEALKRRMFEDSFERLLAWTREQQTAQALLRPDLR